MEIQQKARPSVRSVEDLKNSIRSVEREHFVTILLNYKRENETSDNVLAEEKIVKISNAGAYNITLPSKSHIMLFQFYDMDSVVLNDGTKFAGPRENMSSVYMSKDSDTNEKVLGRISDMMKKRLGIDEDRVEGIAARG